MKPNNPNTFHRHSKVCLLMVVAISIALIPGDPTCGGSAALAQANPVGKTQPAVVCYNPTGDWSQSLALAMAIRSSELDVVAIAVPSGSKGQFAETARLWCYQLSRLDIPVMEYAATQNPTADQFDSLDCLLSGPVVSPTTKTSEEISETLSKAATDWVLLALDGDSSLPILDSLSDSALSKLERAVCAVKRPLNNNWPTAPEQIKRGLSFDLVLAERVTFPAQATDSTLQELKQNGSQLAQSLLILNELQQSSGPAQGQSDLLPCWAYAAAGRNSDLVSLTPIANQGPTEQPALTVYQPAGYWTGDSSFLVKLFDPKLEYSTRFAAYLMSLPNLPQAQREALRKELSNNKIAGYEFPQDLRLLPMSHQQPVGLLYRNLKAISEMDGAQSAGLQKHHLQEALVNYLEVGFSLFKGEKCADVLSLINPNQLPIDYLTVEYGVGSWEGQVEMETVATDYKAKLDWPDDVDRQATSCAYVEATYKLVGVPLQMRYEFPAELLP